MTRSNLPLSGGVYIERPDGRIERLDGTPAAPPARAVRRPPSRGAADVQTASEPSTNAEPAPTE